MSHDNYHEELPRIETQKQAEGHSRPSSHSKHTQTQPMDDGRLLLLIDEHKYYTVTYLTKSYGFIFYQIASQ